MIHRVQEGPKISFFAIDWKSPIFFLQALTFPSLLLAVMALALVALGPGGLVLTPPRPASPTGTHHTSPKQPHSRHLHPHTHPARPWQEITHMLGGQCGSCQLPSLGPRWTQYCTKDIFSGVRSYFHGRYQIMGTSCSNKRPKFPYDITITIIIILLFPWTRKGYYPGDVKLCGKKYTTIIH